MVFKCSERELHVKCNRFDSNAPTWPSTFTDSWTYSPIHFALERWYKRTLRSGYHPEWRIQRPRYCAMRGMVYASYCGPFFLRCQISASSDSLSDSSASSERIQS